MSCRSGLKAGDKSSKIDARPHRELIEHRLKELAARDNADRRKAEQRAKFLLGAVVLVRAAGDLALLANLVSALPDKDRDLIKTVVGRKATADNATKQSAPS